jgi:aspartate 1-decarboxylase
MMLRSLLKSKIHGAKVTGRNLEYVGSITIDRSLIEASGLMAHEKVLVSDMANGSRFETYVIEGGPGEIAVNGAAAKLVRKGDRLIIMAFGLYAEGEASEPRIVSVDGGNRVKAPGP